MVLEQVDIGAKNSKWYCQCECGNFCIKTYNNLKNGKMPNCGCLNSEEISLRKFIDLTGKRFGKLVVKNRVFVEDEKEASWFCECDCGNTKIVKGKYLRGGVTKSCGCLVSYLESLVEKFLQEKNIFYKKQYSFANLYDKNKNYPLRFDFAILDEKNKLIALIECQGKQHYDKSSKFFTEDGIKRDLLKEEYCKNNNIRLIKIYNQDELYQNLNIILKDFLPVDKAAGECRLEDIK